MKLEETQVEPHPELWYEDGNVLLIAENTSFRVHKSVLARSSEFFRDMFSLPQPPPEETPADCEPGNNTPDIPCIHTSETAADLGHYLDALYNSLKYFQKNAQITYPTLRAVLVLAQKFSSEDLRTFAIGRLETAFPRKFTEWEAISEGDRPQPVVYTEDELIQIANLARELGLHDILPVVLYDCCQQDIDWILEGAVSPTTGVMHQLCRENQKSCLLARSKLTAATLAMLTSLSYARDGMCDQYTCNSALREISLGGLINDKALHHPLIVLDEEFESAPQPQQQAGILNMVGGPPVTGIASLCRLCRESCRNQMRIAREKLLNNLQEYIPIDP